MVVDAFVVLGLDAVPADVGDLVEVEGDVADEVLDEDGVFVGAFGDGFFVGALEEGVEFAGSAAFDEGDEVLDPDDLGGSDGDGDVAALVVGGVAADGLGAGACLLYTSPSPRD